MIAIAQITETRAALAVGTVKKRIRMCGSPAVPNTSAMPSEIWSIGALNSRPGSRKRWPRSAADMFFAPSPRICADARLHLRVGDDVGQEFAEETVLRPDHDHEDDRRGDEQHRLDDLHPGRRDHAAEQHVGEHQDADDDHRDLVVDADQRLHQHAAADHLRGQVERRHRDHRERPDDPCRLRVVTVGEDVGQCVLADVAAGLGDDQQHRDVGDQPAHRVHEAVVAPDRDQARDTQERRGRQVVAGDRPAVLQAGDAAAGGVEVGRRLDALRGHIGDEDREADDHGEHQESEPAPPVGDRALRERRGGDGGRCGEDAEGGEIPAFHRRPPIFSASRISSAAIESNSALARRE